MGTPNIGNDLECDFSAQRGLMGKEDDAHAAFAYQTEDLEVAQVLADQVMVKCRFVGVSLALLHKAGK